MHENFAKYNTENDKLTSFRQCHFLYQRKVLYAKYFYSCIQSSLFILSAARFYVFASFIKAPLTWTALIVVSRGRLDIFKYFYGRLQRFLGIYAHYTCHSAYRYLRLFILSAARFYVFASFIKDPLDLDGAICSVVCVTETGLSPSKARRRFPALCYSLLRRVVGLPPGRRQLSEMGEECKDKIFII